MKRKLFIALYFVLVFSLLTFSLGGANNVTSPEDGLVQSIYLPIVEKPFPPPIIPDTTKILPATTTQYLSDISPDGTTFTFSQSTPDLEFLAPDDIMVGDVTTVAPYGFLRKVSSVSDSGGQLIVITTDAVIEEAIQQGGVQLVTTLTPSDIISSTQLAGVSLLQAAETGDEFYVGINNVVLHDIDGTPSTTDDQVTAHGSILLEPGFDFRILVQNWQLEDLYFAINVEETANLEINSLITLPNIQVEFELARYYFAPFTAAIGPFPVWITPILTLNVGVDGSIHAGISAGVVQNATFTCGLNYKEGNWNLVNDLTNTFQYDMPTLSPNLDKIKGFVGPELALMLYGVIGPRGETQAYLELDIDPQAVPWWLLYGGLEASVGVEIKIFSHVVAGYQVTEPGPKILIAQASGGIATPTPTQSTTPTPTITPIITPTPTDPPSTGSWQEVGAGSASGSGISNLSGHSEYPSIAIAPDGMPYVAWVDGNSGNWEIYVRRWNGNIWEEVGVGSASGGGISNNVGASTYPSIAIAIDGTPYVAWEDYSGDNVDIYVRRWNGSNWIEVGAGSANGGGISETAGSSYKPSIAIATDGTPYVVWHDYSNDNAEIYVRRWNGSSWVEVGDGSASGGGISNNLGNSAWAAIAITLDGIPYVAWLDFSDGDDSETYVRSWNGNNWIEVGLGSASGGGISNDSGGTGSPSIATATDGTPYVTWSWSDDSSEDWEIYIRTWNGSNWIEVGAGSASGGGISNNTGDSSRPSIAIAIDGTPYVAWHDFSGGNAEIYVRRWNGSSWIEVGAGSASGGGISNNSGYSGFASLAIALDGIPYIAWEDAINGIDSEIYVLRYIE